MSDEEVVIIEEIEDSILVEELEDVIEVEEIEESIILQEYDGTLVYPVSVCSVVTAGVNLSACKMVVPGSGGKFIYADSSILSHKSIVYGMTTQSIAADESGTVVTSGEVYNDTWNWTLGLPIFLSTSGEITQIPPLTGFSLCIGYPVTKTRIFIRINESITLI